VVILELKDSSISMINEVSLRLYTGQKNNDLDDLWYNTPESRQVSEIYNIEDIFHLRILGLDPYEADQVLEKWD